VDGPRGWLTAHLHLAPSLRMNGAIFPLLEYASWHGQGHSIKYIPDMMCLHTIFKRLCDLAGIMCMCLYIYV
jgi:hypothetical protein